MLYGRELPGMPYTLGSKLTRGIIWTQRKIFPYLRPRAGINPLPKMLTNEEAGARIAELLAAESPCMVARFGAIELDAISRGYYIERPGSKFQKTLDILTGEAGPFWWDNSVRAGLCWNAGFFPPSIEAMTRYSILSREDSRQLDLLAVFPWSNGLNLLSREYFPKVETCDFYGLEFYSCNPSWTRQLKGRKVLVVHPFVDTITRQYARREKLFSNVEYLPEFELKTCRAVSSLAGNKTEYKDWFEALDFMKRQIAATDFDVALIGCGAYGFSLAAFVKRDLGKKAIHLGGSLQLLFGIRGKRWDDSKFHRENLFNEWWVRPSPEETPQMNATIEKGCYW